MREIRFFRCCEIEQGSGRGGVEPEGEGEERVEEGDSRGEEREGGGVDGGLEKRAVHGEHLDVDVDFGAGVQVRLDDGLERVLEGGGELLYPPGEGSGGDREGIESARQSRVEGIQVRGAIPGVELSGRSLEVEVWWTRTKRARQAGRGEVSFELTLPGKAEDSSLRSLRAQTRAGSSAMRSRCPASCAPQLSAEPKARDDADELVSSKLDGVELTNPPFPLPRPRRCPCTSTSVALKRLD